MREWPDGHLRHKPQEGSLQSRLIRHPRAYTPPTFATHIVGILPVHILPHVVLQGNELVSNNVDVERFRLTAFRPIREIL